MMNKKAKDLSTRLKDFNDNMITFIENCSEEEWNKVLDWEKWSIGVTARHIGAGHYEIVDIAKMIVKGEKLPELTMDQITDMANQHARDHGACTKEEVLDLLRTNGASLVDFVSDLDDSQLDSSGYLAAFENDVTVQQLLESVILESAGQHFANMRKIETN
jgi:hypothetical protein